MAASAQAREGPQVRLHTVLLLLNGMLCVVMTAALGG